MTYEAVNTNTVKLWLMPMQMPIGTPPRPSPRQAIFA